MSNKLSRRDFLQAASLTTGAVVLAACQTATSEANAPAATEAPQANPPAAGKKKMIFSSYSWSGYEDAINQVVDQWIQTQTGVELEVERQYGPWDEYWGKLQTQIAAGTPPDLGIADYGRIASYAKNGVILNVSELIKTTNFPLDKMMPSAVAQYRWKDGDFDTGNEAGDLYGLPTDAQSHVMAYNKKMFDEAGVSYPTDDWTWDDLLAAATKLTNADKNQFGISLPYGLMWRGVWVAAAGGATHTADYTKSLLASPETTEAIKWMWDLIYTHKVAPPPPPPNTQAPDPVLSRQAAISINGVWWLSDLAKGLEPGEWDVCMFPKHPKTGKRTTTVESDGWWIFKEAKERDLAWNLLSFMGSVDGQKKFDELGYLIPSCVPDVANAWYSRTPPDNKKKILDNILQDSVKVDITYYENATVQSVVDPIIGKAFADGSDVVQALQDAEKVMNDELERAWASFKK